MKSGKLKKGGEGRKDRWLLIQKDIRKDWGKNKLNKKKTTRE